MMKKASKVLCEDEWFEQLKIKIDNISEEIYNNSEQKFQQILCNEFNFKQILRSFDFSYGEIINITEKLKRDKDIIFIE